MDGNTFIIAVVFKITILHYIFFKRLPLPWADIVPFRMFGVKVGKNVVLYDAWINTEFVEISNFVMISLNAASISIVFIKINS